MGKNLPTIRQYFPKKSNFDLITKSETNKVIQILNNRRQRPTDPERDSGSKHPMKFSPKN
jgi:hypothetical protein